MSISFCAYKMALVSETGNNELFEGEKDFNLSNANAWDLVGKVTRNVMPNFHMDYSGIMSRDEMLLCKQAIEQSSSLCRFSNMELPYAEQSLLDLINWCLNHEQIGLVVGWG